MRCQRCLDRDALVHLSESDGKRAGKVSICVRCAAELGLDNPKAMASANVVSIGALITKHGRWTGRGSEPLDG